MVNNPKKICVQFDDSGQIAYADKNNLRASEYIRADIAEESESELAEELIDMAIKAITHKFACEDFEDRVIPEIKNGDLKILHALGVGLVNSSLVFEISKSKLVKEEIVEAQKIIMEAMDILNERFGHK